MTTAPPRALWVLPVADLGGVARHALDVAREGIPGWGVVFLVPDGPLVGLLRDAGAAVLVDTVGPEHGARASVRALRHAQAKLSPRVVHTHLSYADVVGASAKPRAGCALVTTEHGIADNDAVYHRSRSASRLKARLHSVRVRRADAFIAVSSATLEVARRKWALPRSLPAHVVPNGIDRPHFAHDPGPGLHIVSLARLAPEKRLDHLVRAFAVLAAEYADARLTLAGVGALEGRLRSQVADLGLTDRVAFPGYVEAETLLSRADVLAQLSVFENCSYAVLDALVRRKGVVATPVGGNPEMLPSSALVAADDSAAVARALEVQGHDVASRPTLASNWPSVSDMTARIAGVYDNAVRGLP